MAESQSADKKSRDDLVADSEERGSVEHPVAEGDRGTERNDVAAEERQIHSRLALRHAITHRGNPARDLGSSADLPGENFHLLGIAPVRLMRRKHIVISGHNAEVGPGKPADRVLVLERSGEPMSEITAAETRSADPP